MDTGSRTQREAAGGYPYRGRVLFGLVLAMGLAAMDATIVSTAIPSIVRDLGGFSLFTWVFSIYLLVQAVMVPIYGKLSDLYGRKPVLFFGTGVFLLGSVLCGLSFSMISLIAFRAVQGVGAGAIQPTVTTLAGDMYDVRERARIQGALSSVWGISAVVGPALGGLLSEYASWRWIFYINLPVGALALLVVGIYLKESVEKTHHELDYQGAALLALGVGLVIFGLLEGGVGWPWLSPQIVGVFSLAALLLAAFVRRERRAAEPTLPPWVFGRRLLVGANLSAAVLGLLTIGLTTFLPTYAQGVLGAGAVAAGFSLAVMSIGWPLASTFSGRLYLRIGFRDTALIGSLFCLASGIVFSLLPQSSPLWLATAGSFVMGLGLGLLSTPIVVGLQQVVGWERRGTVTGANMFTRQLGQAVGAALFGTIANSALLGWLSRAPSDISGRVPHTVDAASRLLGGNGAHALDDRAASYVRHGLYLAAHHVFLALAAFALLGIVVLLATPRRFEPLSFGKRG